jgi:hypothetical protein
MGSREPGSRPEYLRRVAFPLDAEAASPIRAAEPVKSYPYWMMRKVAQRPHGIRCVWCGVT